MPRQRSPKRLQNNQIGNGDNSSEDESSSGKSCLAKGFVFHFNDANDEATPTNQEKSRKLNKTRISNLDAKINQKRKRMREESLAKENEKGVEPKEENPKNKRRKVEIGKKGEEEKIKYADVVEGSEEIGDFTDLVLCRPLMRALHKLGWVRPTTIQSLTIRAALQGKDISACAATGTGKTGAFMIPIVEKLHNLHRPRPATKVLVLTPTRELAVQTAEVTKALTEFTKISYTLATGGLNRETQEVSLRSKPDIVIATLGRLIDHLQNAPNFDLSSIEILVLDEADRMLDEYFGEQMKEVIQRCSRYRQTILLSATMTEKVKDLALLSLNNPVKIFVNTNQEVTLNLEQEFVKIHPEQESKREAVIAALLKRTFKQKCVVFIQTRKEVHRLHVLLGLLGIKVGEFHRDLSQTQRLDTLEKFKEGDIDILLATDLMGRGIDIDDVDTVINMTMPTSIERYIHRVGRTARAGKAGRSVTLVGKHEEKMLKEIKKSSKVPLLERIVDEGVLKKFNNRISKLDKEVKEIEDEEQVEKEVTIAELKANKAKNVLLKRKDASQRKRTWFQSHKERLAEKKNLKEKAEKQLIKGSLK